jgi:hypothetical protein
MGPFEIVAIAIVGSFIVKIVTTWMHTHQGNTSGANAKIKELEHRIQQLESGQGAKALEERVHVLEEIVTTDDFDLQQKFRQLEQKESMSRIGDSRPSTNRPR